MSLYIGDTVRLKSGGPIMTVEKDALYGSSEVECSWFDGNEVKRGKFPYKALIGVRRLKGHDDKF